MRSWKMKSIENEEYTKCGVWKMRSVEDAECRKYGVWKFFYLIFNSFVFSSKECFIIS